MPKALRILAHIAAIIALYLVVSGAMFLGLQVTYGTIAMIVALALVGAYIYFAFGRPR